MVLSDMFVSNLSWAAIEWMLAEVALLSQDYASWLQLMFDPWIDVAILLLVSIVAMSDFYRRFYRSIRSAPRLGLVNQPSSKLPKISVVIPAYNESVNVEDCMRAVLANQLPGDSELELIVADDESTDKTFELASVIAKTDNRATVFIVPPRPKDDVWRGKNWACHCAKDKATGTYILFIDADVRLTKDAIVRALVEAQDYKSDLLSCAPAIVCGCFSEWLVQPLMANLIAVGFDFEGVNDPAQEVAIAAGPFMLFRRAAYDKIGGHQAVADNPVEDLALASLVKAQGLSLRYVLGLDAATVRMYRSFGGLWEGWTKNYHLGSQRNIALTVVSAAAVFLIFCIPWFGLVASVAGAITHAISDKIAMGLVGLSAAAVIIQVVLRWISSKVIGQPLRYLWLGWAGGLLVSAIAIISLIKTETGWGWTWRGRSLARPPQKNR